MLKPVRTIAPAADLLTLAEAKNQCNVDHDDDDMLLNAYIAAAMGLFDGYGGIGRAFINQTWAVAMGCWPSCRIDLPLAPVSAIGSITYYDTANALQTLAGGNYMLLEDALAPHLRWTAAAVLPALYDRDDAITVTFTAGYGAAATDVPARVIHAMKLLIAHWYANREAVNVGNITSELPFAVDALIGPLRRTGF